MTTRNSASRGLTICLPHQENPVFTYLCFSCFFCLWQAKKANSRKALLAWEKQSLVLFTYFFFLFYNPTWFLCKLDCMSHLLFLYQWYFLYFFDLIYLCKQSTCMMSLASTLASTGDYFFYFFAKKYEKQQKSTKSKNRVFLMHGHVTTANGPHA